MNRAMADRVTSGVLIVLIALYLWQASGYNANARLVPYIVGIAALAFAVVTLASPVLRAVMRRGAAGKEDAADDPPPPGYRIRLAFIVGWTILLGGAVIAAGFVVSVPLFTLALFVISERRLSITAVFLTVALTALSWIFTVELLAHGWLEAPLWQWLARMW